MTSNLHAQARADRHSPTTPSLYSLNLPAWFMPGGHSIISLRCCSFHNYLDLKGEADDGDQTNCTQGVVFCHFCTLQANVEKHFLTAWA